ncbi:hypothetical protein V5799_014623 [Amblyomma americanum]|uniref:Uncharacterized protein n=1 Tax=Amblyomma americanum TaxID=6943 RepID=A0AAQ4E2H4_AMBAM
MENSTTDNTTMSSLSPGVQKRAPLAKAVLCSIGSGQTELLPPDGLCDYTFGHHLYTPFHKGFLGRPEHNQLMFIEAASKQTRTEYGNSFPIRSISSLLSDFEDDAAPASALYYWDKRFYHYGFVDVGLGEGYREMRNILTALNGQHRYRTFFRAPTIHEMG